MKKSDIEKLPKYFDYYIQLNEDIELTEAFNKSLNQIDNIDIEQLNRIGLDVYEAGKWSINKIIQHLIDWERIWCYRTLLFARQEGTIPDLLEDQIMAEHSNADDLSKEQLITELRAVRIATKAMFDSFNDEMLEINCKFSNYEMSILAMGFNIIGHQLHHYQIIKERYIPLDK